MGAETVRQVDGHRVRIEIQALRALAVSLVVVYHMEAKLLPGGYVGVDVFFVISGFLITGHIARALNGPDGFSLADFYVRRARRLLPAALTVLCTVGVTTLLFLPLTTWNSIGKQVIASALYVQNWVLASSAVDYMAAATSSSPLKHFWSLSVEEQFYLGWPLALMVAAFIGRRSDRVQQSLMLWILLIFALSFGYSIWQTNVEPAWAYFVTPTRIWELGVGGFLAILVSKLKWGSRARCAASWIGLLAIFISAALFDSTTSFPGYAAALPVAGTAMVIAAGEVHGKYSTSKIAGLPFVQFLGDNSYSIYLWHWPLIIMTPMLINGPGSFLPFWLRPLPVIASIFLAWLTKKYIEDPFRPGGTLPLQGRLLRLPRRAILTSGSVLMAVAIAVGSSLLGVSQARIDRAETAMLAFQRGASNCVGAVALYPQCVGKSPKGVHPDPIIASRDAVDQQCQQTRSRSDLLSCDFGVSDRPTLRMAIVGDSHSQQWIEAIEQLADRRRWHVTTYFKSSCPYAEGVGSASCREFNAAVKAALLQNPVDVVVTSTRSSRSFGVLANVTEVMDGFKKAWTSLRHHGMRVIAIADTPQPIDAGVFDPASRVAEDPSFALSRSLALRGSMEVPNVVLSAGADYLDMTDFFCQGSICPGVIGGVLVYRDADHITATYSRSLAVPLERSFDRALGAIRRNGRTAGR